MTEKKKYRRAAFNEVLPGKLYQRGRFQSWPRKKKDRILTDHNIGLVVNLWSKVDPEVSNDTYRTYLHFPMRGNVPPPYHILSGVLTTIRAFITYDQAVLIHCEAGVNRSVFMSACVVAMISNVSGEEAMKLMKEVCGRIKVNPKLIVSLLERYR